ncbi:MAG: HAD-IIB family hydrolase [Chitinophagaceae bacterium]|nr:HAD-IIB family hydrolase [Chitinophagaceae bacterium]
MKYTTHKIFVFDVGNTLIAKPSNRMVSVLVNDLSAIKNAGNVIGIATMRNLEMLNEIISQVNFDFIIALNGAYVECENKILLDSPIDIKELIQITNMLNHYSANYNLYTKSRIVNLTEQRDIVYGIELKDCSNYIDSLRSQFTNFTFHIWEKGKTCDIHSINVSKSIAMKQVCEHFGIPLQNSIAFGDGFNDFELFKLCGVSVAMETAPSELKQIATFITKSVTDNGVSWALKQFPLWR